MRNVNYDAVLSLLAERHRAGKPIPFVTVVGQDEISCKDIKGASPLTKINLRIYRQGEDSLDMGVAQWIETNVEHFEPRWSADWLQPNNEVIRFDPDAIAWYRAALQYAESRGYKLAVPTWAVGNPGDMSIWLRSDVLDLLRAIRDGKHLLSLHEYDIGAGDYGLGRFAHHVYPTLPADLRNNMPTVGFTEFGEQGGRNMPRDVLLGKMRTWQNLMAPYPWIVGGAIWTAGDTGNTDWQGDNIAANIDLLAQV